MVTKRKKNKKNKRGSSVSARPAWRRTMDVYQEAVDYLDSQQVPVECEAKTEEEEEEVSCLLSPLHTESLDLPDTPTPWRPEEMLERRLVVLRGILKREEVYLRELDALLMPMKALWASAGTSQPVLSTQEVQTVFYQVPEIRDMHQSFYSGLKARLNGCDHNGSGSGDRPGLDLMVGDLFLKMVNQFSLYGGFIGNYEEAVEVVRRCAHTDARFRTLAESMMSNTGSEGKYTFEALLYRPLDRVTKTTLVLRDVLKTTPAAHVDHASLQEALRLSRSFLAGVNESSQSKREVTLSRRMNHRLMRDGFVVDASEGERYLRHLFLYTDLLLCTRVKRAGRGKQDHYRFCWYLTLARLKLRWVAEQRSPDLRLHAIRSKMFVFQQQLRQHKTKASRILAARSRKKVEQMELMLLTHSPQYRLELHSASTGTHSLLFSSLYELEEWREAIHKLTTDDVETVPPDLLTLTGSCVKLRMTQQPPLQSSSAVKDEESLCGTLGVAVHSARGLEQPACAYVCLEVDGYEFHDRQAQTHSSVRSLNPHWDQELYFQVDGAQQLKVICVSQPCVQGDDAVVAKTSVQLDPKTLTEQWRRQTLSLGQVKLAISLKYRPHQVGPPTLTSQQQPVFGVPIAAVARQEGGLVPHVVRCCVEEVERRGMDEVGIYRVSGGALDISTLKAAFDSNLREAVTRLRSAEVNVVCGVLKLYFRELPEPLVPTELFHRLAQMLEFTAPTPKPSTLPTLKRSLSAGCFLSSPADIQEVQSRLPSLVSVLQSCPEPNRHTFLYLLHHLQRVSEKQDSNKMSLMNLATVFGPSLLRPPVAGLGPGSVPVDISQEVVVQVQVVFWFLQCRDLPEARTSLQPDSDQDDESTHL
ncbi:active breakpoint cluster region-related protein isoform X1 [Takifugu rubripes]|uniref:active breakpoint cluster region-related protein isoform X1 n=1 Tax=Takifugu rubripes TaxID=31033 RepID=UPI0011457381|nr:active breakpoint cluster region-related protein-like isoform X1 [Takifugu rubripes]